MPDTSKCCSSCLSWHISENGESQVWCNNSKCSNCHQAKECKLECPNIKAYGKCTTKGCSFCGGRPIFTDTSKKEWEYAINAFYNDVVEACVRYIKGKGNGEDPNTYMSKQLAHWEGNLKSTIDLLLTQQREEYRKKVDALIKNNEESYDYKTGEYWSTYGYPKALDEVLKILK